MFNKRIYIVLISVFILIFSLTCVSAAQDNITTDELAVDENVAEYTVSDDDSSQGDLISKSSDEKAVSESQSDDILKYKSEQFGNVTMDLYYTADTEEHSYDNFAHVTTSYRGDSHLDGQVILTIDNKEYYNRIFYSKDYYYQVSINSNYLNLPDNLKTGYHNVTLSYLENGKSTPYTISQIISFRHDPTIKATYGTDSINYTINCFSENNGNFTVYEYINDELGARHSERYKGEFISSGIISNGKGEITINNINPIKRHEFRFYVNINGQEYMMDDLVYSELFNQSKDSNESGIANDTGKTNSSTTNNQSQNTDITPQTKPVTTKITAKNIIFKATKKTKTYTITLKAGKKAVKKVKVTLKIGKKTFKATTNNNGKAVFKISLNKKGTYNSKITFKGNKNYKATSKTVKITIK